MGLFALLPRELRDQIWGYMSAERRFTFFQSSRQIYADASPIIYRDLVFHIEPRYQCKSWLTVESSFNARWLFQNLNDAINQGFNKLPFEQLRKIQINIEAPDRTDPGQVICLHKKCTDLAELLENAKQGLPDLEIRLIDSDKAQWTSKGKPQMSLASEDDIVSTKDHEIVLLTFVRLRNARSVNIRVPIVFSEGYGWIENMANTLMAKDPVGTYLEASNAWNDEENQEDLDDIFMELDLKLDSLHGHTAHMMRLDRFSSWYTSKLGGYSKYEERYERIIRGQEWNDSDMLDGLHHRYGVMRAFDPFALVRLQKDDDWDHDLWENWYCTEGIPPKNSLQCLKQVLLRWGENACEQYEDKFEEKLTEWNGGRKWRLRICNRLANSLAFDWHYEHHNVALMECPIWPCPLSDALSRHYPPLWLAVGSHRGSRVLDDAVDSVWYELPTPR
ncbi:MAG: hypothetical protein Q9170_007378 [Blastenia crenularia]